MEFARFALVGVSNTALTWAIYLFLAGYRHVDPVVANIIAWTISSAWSFAWNRRFTFRSRDSDIRGQAARFAAANLSAIGLSTLIIALFRHHPLWVGQGFATAATMAWNYAMCRRVVFAERSNTA